MKSLDTTKSDEHLLGYYTFKLYCNLCATYYNIIHVGVSSLIYCSFLLNKYTKLI